MWKFNVGGAALLLTLALVGGALAAPPTSEARNLSPEEQATRDLTALRTAARPAARKRLASSKKRKQAAATAGQGSLDQKSRLQKWADALNREILDKNPQLLSPVDFTLAVSEIERRKGELDEEVLRRARPLTPSALYQQADPAIVSIIADAGEVSQGTGFAYGPWIVTCRHVVKGASKIACITAKGTSFEISSIAWEDAANDLVLLDLPEAHPDLNTTLTVERGRVASVGDTIYTIGTPRGLSHTLSTGMISSVRVENFSTLLQITAPVSHGSSGSPVLNAYGRVVGVIVGTIEDGQNLNFAASANHLPERISVIQMSLDRWASYSKMGR